MRKLTLLLGLAEKSMTDVDEYGMSIVKGAVMVDPHTGDLVGN